MRHHGTRCAVVVEGVPGATQCKRVTACQLGEAGGRVICIAERLRDSAEAESSWWWVGTVASPAINFLMKIRAGTRRSTRPTAEVGGICADYRSPLVAEIAKFREQTFAVEARNS